MLKRLARKFYIIKSNKLDTLDTFLDIVCRKLIVHEENKPIVNIVTNSHGKPVLSISIIPYQTFDVARAQQG
jgi:hypothetical protein